MLVMLVAKLSFWSIVNSKILIARVLPVIYQVNLDIIYDVLYVGIAKCFVTGVMIVNRIKMVGWTG